MEAQSNSRNTNTTAPTAGLLLQGAASTAIEDYLKAIYILQQRDGAASTNNLCAQLGGLKPGSVSQMLGRLAERGFIEHELYHGARLTPVGEQAALNLIRNHRLIETFLVVAFGYRWDEVHAEADRLEHHVSRQLVDRIAAYLGHPTTDPHGDPIPQTDGTLPEHSAQKLSDAPLHTPLVIRRVLNQDSALLCYLGELGLVPGAIIEITSRAPFDGPLQMLADGIAHVLDYRLAQAIIVMMK